MCFSREKYGDRTACELNSRAEHLREKNVQRSWAPLCDPSLLEMSYESLIVMRYINQKHCAKTVIAKTCLYPTVCLVAETETYYTVSHKKVNSLEMTAKADLSFICCLSLHLFPLTEYLCNITPNDLHSFRTQHLCNIALHDLNTLWSTLDVCPQHPRHTMQQLGPPEKGRTDLSILHMGLGEGRCGTCLRTDLFKGH